MKKDFCSISLILFFLLLWSCFPVSISKNTPVIHKYEILVVDKNDNPLGDVSVEYVLKDGENIVKKSTGTTISNGLFQISIRPTIDQTFSNIKLYNSKIDYKIFKVGYYPKNGTMSILNKEDDYYANTIKKDKVVLRTVKQIPSVFHRYEISIVDIDGCLLDSVTIKYTMKSGNKIIKDNITKLIYNGIFIDSLKVETDTTLKYSKIFSSKFDYTVSKDGYYEKTGHLSSRYGTDYSEDKPVQKDKIVLIRTVDYFNKDFVLSSTNENLRNDLYKFVDLIIFQSLLTESFLETHSIDLISFKGYNYVQLKFINMNVFNSLRFDKYDIGKWLFDEVVRKMLSPLNDYIDDSENFYGYSIIIDGHTKNFADKYAVSKKIEYKFMIPRDIVSEYKNQDISGQQVLDSSIILMDNERVELKLQ